MRRTHWYASAAVILVLGSVAVADKLSDFKEAAGKAGCDSIPYGDLRSDCASQSGYVHDWCDGGRGPVTCTDEQITRQLKENVDRARQRVDELEQKRRDLDDRRGRATDDEERERLGKELAQVERDLYEAKQRVDQAVRELEARAKLVSDAIYNLDQCLAYRRAVMNIFAYAIDRVRGETDDDVKPYARQLRDQWESEKRGHEMQISAREKAVDTCKRSVP